MATLAEIKEENAKDEEIKTEEETEEVVEEVVEEESEETEEEPEAWMKSDDQQSDDVPVATHVKMKHKYKNRISERDEEIEKLRAENEKLRQQSNTVEKIPERPMEHEFDTTEEYKRALDEYETAKIKAVYNQETRDKRIKEEQLQAQQEFNKKLIEHKQRIDDLIETKGIKEDAYIAAEANFIDGINSVMPGRGKSIKDELATILEDGFEKGIYYLGMNSKALEEVKLAASQDRSGNKLIVHLAKLQERLNNPIKRTSKAPKPASSASGDVEPTTVSERKLKKAYEDAHKGGNLQAAWNAKKKAKSAGIDVSAWS